MEYTIGARGKTEFPSNGRRMPPCPWKAMYRRPERSRRQPPAGPGSRALRAALRRRAPSRPGWGEAGPGGGTERPAGVEEVATGGKCCAAVAGDVREGDRPLPRQPRTMAAPGRCRGCLPREPGASSRVSPPGLSARLCCAAAARWGRRGRAGAVPGKPRLSAAAQPASESSGALALVSGR